MIGLRQFFWEMMVVPALRRKELLVRIFVALLFLSVAQSLLLILVKGFLVAFFADPNQTKVGMSELLPAKVIPWVGVWQNHMIAKQTLAWLVPVAIVIAGCLKAFATYWYNFSQEEVALRVAREYRERMFAAILRLPWLSSAKRNPGEWMSVIMADAVFLQSRLSELLTGFVKDAVLILACLVTLAVIYWPAAVVLAVITPFIGWSMGRAGKRIAYFAEAFQKELGHLAGTLMDIRSRFRYMKSQRGEAFEQRIFADANNKYLNMMLGSIFIRALVTPAMEWVGLVLFAGFVFLWTHGHLGAEFTPEIALQFFVAMGVLLRPTREMGEQIARWGETVGGLRRSMAVFSEVNAPSTAGSTEAIGSNGVVRMKPVVEWDQIDVRYGERSAFKAQHLSLESGRAVAVVGPSGAGKSTLMKCLGGLVEPYGWWCSHTWVDVIQHCALVSQQPFLFQDTLRQNLVYGLEPEVVRDTTDEMLYGALRIVHMADAVQTLPHGLETIFNPVAHNFSGGQIQRLVVARALLRRRPILLLDEAMAAIDGATERDMTSALISTVHETGTVLVSVTHRLQWLESYDEVWFVVAGEVALKGKHTELLGDERYAAFVRAESSPGGDA